MTISSLVTISTGTKELQIDAPFALPLSLLTFLFELCIMEIGRMLILPIYVTYLTFPDP